MSARALSTARTSALLLAILYTVAHHRCAVRLKADFIAQPRADAILETLLGETPWEHKPIKLFGKEIMQPRLTAWYGEPGATYEYSGLMNEPIAWTPLLLELKALVEAEANHRFNSALINQYRDGRDSLGLHADAEPELGKNPLIASLSFGATRRFVIVPKKKQQGERTEMNLTHGSLLIMDGDLQHTHKHGVPKQLSVTAPRINLTFRFVNAPDRSA